MIFVTVGTQLPFPRMLQAIDRIAGRHGLEVFAQTADASPDLKHIDHSPHLSPAEYRAITGRAERLVGHAGIGTVLTAKKLRKPLIIFPRRASLGEHRNEHQLATARALQAVAGIHIADDEAELEALLLTRDLAPASAEASPMRDRLTRRIAEFAGQGEQRD